jgi:hypothetical protein
MFMTMWWDILHNHLTQLDTMAVSTINEISIWDTVFFMNQQRKKSLLGARSSHMHDDQYIGQNSHLDQRCQGKGPS